MPMGHLIVGETLPAVPMPWVTESDGRQTASITIIDLYASGVQSVEPGCRVVYPDGRQGFPSYVDRDQLVEIFKKDLAAFYIAEPYEVIETPSEPICIGEVFKIAKV